MAFFIGALIITRLMSWVLRAAFRFGELRLRIALSHIGSLALATVIGAFGLADEGPPVFALAFASYVLPVMLWAVIDLYRAGRPGKA